MKYIDMLSRLGIGSAHPGGFSASLAQFRKFPLPRNAHILEVGCGTGRTACHLAEEGYQVSAIDIHPEMLVKANMRAKAMGVDVLFTLSDVCSMPFSDNFFDVIIAESVTNFTQAERSIQEYYRVLKTGGILYDREMLMSKPIPIDLLEQIKTFFEIQQLLNQEDWVKLLKKCQFKEAEFIDVSTFNYQTKEDQIQLPDPHQFFDEGVILDKMVWQYSFQHAQIISDNAEYLAYGLMKAIK